MKSFITGSQIYGKPNEQSDIDLVIFGDNDLKKELRSFQGPRTIQAQSKTRNGPIKFGNLNLIVVTDEIEYLAWLHSLRKCRALSLENEVKKSQAIHIHDEVRNFLGLNYNNNSGE